MEGGDSNKGGWDRGEEGEGASWEGGDSNEGGWNRGEEGKENRVGWRHGGGDSNEGGWNRGEGCNSTKRSRFRVQFYSPHRPGIQQHTEKFRGCRVLMEFIHQI